MLVPHLQELVRHLGVMRDGNDVMKKTSTVLSAVLALASINGAAQAQVQLERFERQLEQIRRETQLLMVSPEVPPDQRLYYDFGGDITFNFLAIDDPLQNTHILRQTSLTGYGRLNFDGAHDFFLRGRVTYNDFNSGDSFDGEGDEWVGPRLERAIYRFDLARYMGAYHGKDLRGNVVVQGGRQLVHWTSGLVLSRELDGAMIDLSWEDVTLTILAGRTVEDTADIDSSRPDFDDETRRNFFGGMIAWQVTPYHRPYVYGLVQEDDNSDDTLSIGGTTTRFDYNSFYIGIGSSGNLTRKLLYGIEFVYQGGDTLSNSFDNQTFIPGPQTRDDIEAWAMNAILDYQFGDANRTRANIELIVASGDDDRLHSTNTFAGNQPGTRDKAFNGFGLLNTGLAFNTNVSNLLVVRTGASTFPLAGTTTFDRLQIGIDLFLFNKYDSDAPIDEPTSDHRYLGFETDLYATWQVTSDLVVAARYGVFFPGKAILTDNDPRHFFFTGVTLGF